MKNRSLLLFILTLFLSHASAQSWTNFGPEGGFFKDFAFHPTEAGTFYAGSDDGGGVWKSDITGEWELLTKDYPNFTGWHIEIDQNHPDTMYFCELYGRYGILKTTDGGETFEELTEGFNFARDLQTTQLVIYPGAGDTLFASTGEGGDFGRVGHGVFSSYNGGANWNYAGLQDESVHCINVTNTNRLFAGTDQSGLWYSDDVGETWLLHPDIPDTAAVLQMDKKNDVFVVSGGANGVYLSFDHGVTFANIGLVGEINFDLSIIKTSPVLEIISSGFFGPNRFSSETLLWTPVSSPLLDDQLMIGIESQGNTILMGIFSSTRIFSATDGGDSWNHLSSDPFATEIRSINVDPDYDYLIASVQNSYNLSGDRYNKHCLSVSLNDGETWSYTGPFAHGMDIARHPVETEIVFFGTFAQGLFKSLDRCGTWESARPGNKLILDVVIDPESPDEMLIAELDIPTITTGIFKSIDQGESWYNTSDITATQIVYNTDNDTVFFSTENGIYISDDKGESIFPSPTYFGGDVVLSMYYNSPYLYAGTQDGQLYKIDNDGLVDEITGDWNADGPTEVRNILYEAGSIIVGLNGAEQDSSHNLNGGVWQSIDNGESWMNITADLTNTNIYGNTALAVARNGDLIVGTYGQSLFRTGDVLLSTPKNKLEVPLVVIFPNPTNGDTQIAAKSEIESVVISAMDGKVVYENYHVQATQILIDQSQLDSGVYLVTIQVNGLATTQQLVVK